MYKTNLLKISLLAIVAIISTFTTTQAQNRAYTGTDRQLQTLLERIETQTDAFSREIDRSLDRSSIDGTTREDSITSMVSNFEQATDTLRDIFTTRRSSASDVQEVLNRYIDQHIHAEQPRDNARTASVVAATQRTESAREQLPRYLELECREQ
ncbi:MAG: hypothetical protein IPG67_04005 [Acidobacteria bacterium]|nr:hypothetical protein [Acidobacteriota bacterium]